MTILICIVMLLLGGVDTYLSVKYFKEYPKIENEAGKAITLLAAIVFGIAAICCYYAAVTVFFIDS